MQEEDRLSDLVQGLPQELFDEILRLVLTINIGTVRIVPNRYRPPVELQIDTATRSRNAVLFYAHSVFKIPQQNLQDPIEICKDWLHSLEQVNRGRICSLKTPGDPYIAHFEDHGRLMASIRLAELARHLEFVDLRVSKGGLLQNYRWWDDDDDVKKGVIRE